MSTANQLAEAVAALGAARSRRDALIAQMHAEGASLRTIGAAADLSATGVMKVLRRET